MPFLNSPTNPYHTCTTLVIRSAHPHTGTSFVTRYFAQKAITDEKKVLIFDTLLGLQNYSSHQNLVKITMQVLNGERPLTDIITHENGADVISQRSDTNINACSITIQHSIKTQLDILKQNYDLLLIDASSHAPRSLFIQDQTTYWVTTPETPQILDTLRMASTNQNPQIIINKIQNPSQQNQTTLLIKHLCPTANIVDNIFWQKT